MSADRVDGEVRLSIEGRIATLVIDRPEARNALNLSMWRAIRGLIAEAESLTDVV